MVEVDASLALIGPHGPLTLLEAFEGRRQLIAYYFMWHPGRPAAEQCEGCTWCATQVAELSYLHSRDITYAVFCQGPYDESARYRDFMGWDMPWYSAQDSLAALLTGRQIDRMYLVCQSLRDGSRCSRPTGPPSAASRPWTTATLSWTSPCTDAAGAVGGLATRLATAMLHHTDRRRPARVDTTIRVARVAGRAPHPPMAPPRSRAL